MTDNDSRGVRAVKEITKTARQVLTALGQYPYETSLVNVWMAEEGAHFATRQGIITPCPEQVLGFLGEPEGKLIHIEFNEAAQTVQFTVE
jgi:hypothetical protein